jgi:hypothetical protein
MKETENKAKKAKKAEKKAQKEKRPKTGPLAIRGCMQGQMIMADDFDDPIEGFEDYM